MKRTKKSLRRWDKQLGKTQRKLKKMAKEFDCEELRNVVAMLASLRDRPFQVWNTQRTDGLGRAIVTGPQE